MVELCAVHGHPVSLGDRAGMIENLII
jgi:hypothetical protein